VRRVPPDAEHACGVSSSLPRPKVHLCGLCRCPLSVRQRVAFTLVHTVE
jgi:hypothetical protein